MADQEGHWHAVRCLNCQNHFFSPQDGRLCPFCGSDRQEEVKEDTQEEDTDEDDA